MPTVNITKIDHIIKKMTNVKINNYQDIVSKYC